jgi:hypothetical protein
MQNWSGRGFTDAMGAAVARSKKYSRTAGETVFTDPREAARHLRALMKEGAQVHGSRSAMSAVGLQPQHYNAPAGRAPFHQGRPNSAGLPDQEAKLLAQQTDMASGPVPISYAPTPSLNPQNPRTVAAGYDPVLQRMRVEWGDGGPAYNYYNVPPQIWDSFQHAPSPGKYINAVLNYFTYGPAED